MREGRHPVRDWEKSRMVGASGPLAGGGQHCVKFVVTGLSTK